MPLAVPQIPPQSTPPIDNRSGDLTLPPLFSRAWYLYFNEDSAALATLSRAVDGLGAATQSGTHAQRTSTPASSVQPGSIFVETDRNGLVYQSQGSVWVYVAGIYQRTQAQLAALAATLTANDNGLLVNVTDYAHMLMWTNPAWGWGPGDPGSGMLLPFAIAPTGNGWQLCDGTTGVTYLKADGSTGTVNLPNTNATAAYLKNGPAYSATITGATVPTISTPTITVNNATLTQAGFTAGAVQADTQATHNHTATSTTPTATLPGDPVPNFPAPLYFRK